MPLLKILKMTRIQLKMIRAKEDFEMCFYGSMEQQGKKVNKFMKIMYVSSGIGMLVWYIQEKLYEIKISNCKHEFVDEGYATPESGCIDMVCKKCGMSHRTILY
jgi:hypothetical protein